MHDFLTAIQEDTVQGDHSTTSLTDRSPAFLVRGRPLLSWTLAKLMSRLYIFRRLQLPTPRSSPYSSTTCRERNLAIDSVERCRQCATSRCESWSTREVRFTGTSSSSEYLLSRTLITRLNGQNWWPRHGGSRRLWLSTWARGSNIPQFNTN